MQPEPLESSAFRHDYSYDVSILDDMISAPSREFNAYSVSSSSTSSSNSNEEECPAVRQPFSLTFKDSPLEEASSKWNDPPQRHAKIKQIDNIGTFGWPEEWTDVNDKNDEVLTAIELNTLSGSSSPTETNANTDTHKDGSRQDQRRSSTVSDTSSVLKNLSTVAFREYSANHTLSSSSGSSSSSESNNEKETERRLLENKKEQVKKGKHRTTNLILTHLQSLKDMYTRLEVQLLNTRHAIDELKTDIELMARSPRFDVLGQVETDRKREQESDGLGTPFNSPDGNFSPDDFTKAGHHIAMLSELAARRALSFSLDYHEQTGETPMNTLASMEEGKIARNASQKLQEMIDRNSDIQESHQTPTNDANRPKKSDDLEFEKKVGSRSRIEEAKESRKDNSTVVNHKSEFVDISNDNAPRYKSTRSQMRIASMSTRAMTRSTCTNSPLDVASLSSPHRPSEGHSSEEELPPHRQPSRTRKAEPPVGRKRHLQKSQGPPEVLDREPTVQVEAEDRKKRLGTLRVAARNKDEYGARQHFLQTATAVEIAENFSLDEIVAVVNSDALKPSPKG